MIRIQKVQKGLVIVNSRPYGGPQQKRVRIKVVYSGSVPKTPSVCFLSGMMSLLGQEKAHKHQVWGLAVKVEASRPISASRYLVFLLGFLYVS